MLAYNRLDQEGELKWPQTICLFLLIFLLLLNNLGAPRIVVFLVACLAYPLLTYPSGHFKAIKNNLMFMAFAGTALVSTLWSELPLITLRASLQLGVTCLIALYIGSNRQADKSLFTLTWALFIYVVLSLFFGKTVYAFDLSHTALTGFGGGAKNFFSDTACAGYVFAMTSAALCFKRKQVYSGVAYLAMTLICAYATLRGYSAGATLSLVLVAVVFLSLLCISWFKVTTRAIILIILAILIGFGLYFKDDIMAFILNIFHKSPNLTGRTFLWYKAQAYMAQKPNLGVGYYAFWNPENPEAIGLWEYFKIDNQTGFSFHNAYIETLVGMGRLGFGVFIFLLLWAGYRALKIIFVNPSIIALGAVTYFIYYLSRSGVENMIPTPFAYFTQYLFIAIALMGVALQKEQQA